MSEYDYIINKTLNRYAGTMSEWQLVEEVKSWMDAESVDYNPDVIEMLVPQCLERFLEQRRRDRVRIGAG